MVGREIFRGHNVNHHSCSFRIYKDSSYQVWVENDSNRKEPFISIYRNGGVKVLHEHYTTRLEPEELKRMAKALKSELKVHSISILRLQRFTSQRGGVRTCRDSRRVHYLRCSFVHMCSPLLYVSSIFN